jgi:hypothetical protein
VRLVDDEEKVLREVVEQRRRRLARTPTREMPRIVLDAVAVAELLDHLEVEHRALVEALCFEELAAPVQFGQPFLELLLDRLDRPVEGLPRRRVEGARVESEAVGARDRRPAERIDPGDLFDLVAKELDAHGDVLVGRMDLQDVPPDAERSARQVEARSLVLHLDELRQQAAHPGAVAHLEVGEHVVVRVGRAEAVDA